MEDFRQSLLALQVPDAEQRELNAIFEDSKDEIVIAAFRG
jgi:hypothetical protein